MRLLRDIIAFPILLVGLILGLVTKLIICLGVLIADGRQAAYKEFVRPLI